MRQVSGPELRGGDESLLKRQEAVEAHLMVRPLFVPDFLKRIAKFQKIAARHGQEVSARFIERVMIDHPVHGKKRKQARDLYAVVVPPMVGVKGRILGHFDKAESGEGQYVHVFHEGERAAVEALIPRAGQCDHCGKVRQRIKSFIVEHDGKVQIVGSNCLIDYLGVDPAWAIAASEWLDESRQANEGGGWGGSAKYVELMPVVEAAFKAGKLRGGYPAGDARYAFRHEVSVLVFGARSKEDAEILKEFKGFDPGPLDLQALADYVEGAKGDFGRNLQLAFEQDVIHVKRMALVVAGVAMWVGRSLKRAEAPKAEPKQPPKAFSEAVGQRIDFEAEVVRAIPHQGNFGMILILNLKASDGRQAVIFHGGRDKPEAGKRYKVRASIKKHQEGYKGWGRESVMNRAVFEEIAAQADDNQQKDWHY